MAKMKVAKGTTAGPAKSGMHPHHGHVAKVAHALHGHDHYKAAHKH